MCLGFGSAPGMVHLASARMGPSCHEKQTCGTQDFSGRSGDTEKGTSSLWTPQVETACEVARLVPMDPGTDSMRSCASALVCPKKKDLRLPCRPCLRACAKTKAFRNLSGSKQSSSGFRIIFSDLPRRSPSLIPPELSRLCSTVGSDFGAILRALRSPGRAHNEARPHLNDNTPASTETL